MVSYEIDMLPIEKYISIHWLVAAFSGPYAHIQKICTAGFCTEDFASQCEPNLSSVIFVLAVSFLCAEYQLWPSTLKRPPLLLLILFEAFTSALVSNIAYRLIWLPMVGNIAVMCVKASRVITHINRQLGFGKYSTLFSISRWLETECALDIFTVSLALLFFFWMLYAIETLDQLWENLSKFYEMIIDKVLHRQKSSLRCNNPCPTLCRPVTPRRGGRGGRRHGDDDDDNFSSDGMDNIDLEFVPPIND